VNANKVAKEENAMNNTLFFCQLYYCKDFVETRGMTGQKCQSLQEGT